MIDQCKYCVLRGDWDGCRATECNSHENWISIEMGRKIARLTAKNKELEERDSEKRNMLEDVVNELDLSGKMIEKHGPLGTSPSELVRLVLEEKDLKIRMLESGFRNITKEHQ